MLDRMGGKSDVPYSWAYQTLLYHREYQYKSPRELWEFLVCVMDFAWLFIESDNAYRFRIQDVIPLVNKEAVKQDVVREVDRILSILIERENPSCGIKYKWQAIKKLGIPFLRFNKDMREFTKEFLLELNFDKIKMDEHDYYFSRRRHTYMFEGKPTHERIKEAYKMDKEKGHVRMQYIELFQDIQCPTCKNPSKQRIAGVKVVQQPT